MIARFDSRCPFCGGKVRAPSADYEGDEIAKRGTQWGHKLCPTTVAAVTQPASHPKPSAVQASMVAGLKRAIAAVEAEESIDLPPVVEEQLVDSIFQSAIYDWVQNGSGHAVVEAVAGSGKTTTLLRALAFTPKDVLVAFCAFNKHIATEIETRLKARGLDHVQASTLHSMGFAALRNAYGLTRDSVDNMKVERIMDAFIPVDPDAPPVERAAARTKRSILRKIVSLCKAVRTTSELPSLADLEALTDRYGIETEGLGDKLFPLVGPVLTQCMANYNVIDYDDMLWLPVVLNLPLTRYHWLMIDEAQDLNPVQIAFVLRSIHEAGRVIAVGDRKQSLYGFRGADVQAIPNLIKALNATVLPLSICYRCPASHVALAKEIVPQIEARPDAPKGVIETISAKTVTRTVQVGDMILCRVNAPLVPMAFDFIRRGIKATLRGRDIGKGIIDFIRKFQTDSVDDLLVRMDEYMRRELARLEKREGKEMEMEMLIDKCSVISAVADECDSVRQMVFKLESLFSDKVEGVVLSSVHKAKGLQAKRVVILKPELLPHPRAEEGTWQMEQEMNCKYVAVTRSTSELYFVEKEQG